MIKKSLLFTLALTSIFGNNLLLAQSKSEFDEAFKLKVEKNAKEYFKNAPQFRTAEYMPLYLEEQSRIEIKTKPIEKGEHYVLLSSLQLLNKYNPELKRDDAQTFNPETFNPLKYNFYYFPKKDVIYRVDSTNYIIIIHPHGK
jgi:hypothetical protein